VHLRLPHVCTQCYLLSHVCLFVWLINLLHVNSYGRIDYVEGSTNAWYGEPCLILLGVIFAVVVMYITSGYVLFAAVSVLSCSILRFMSVVLRDCACLCVSGMDIHLRSIWLTVIAAAGCCCLFSKEDMNVAVAICTCGYTSGHWHKAGRWVQAFFRTSVYNTCCGVRGPTAVKTFEQIEQERAERIRLRRLVYYEDVCGRRRLRYCLRSLHCLPVSDCTT
jgi:hypothetical protein